MFLLKDRIFYKKSHFYTPSSSDGKRYPLPNLQDALYSSDVHCFIFGIEFGSYSVMRFSGNKKQLEGMWSRKSMKKQEKAISPLNNDGNTGYCERSRGKQFKA